MLVNLFCAFLCFWALLLIGFLLLHLEAVFTSIHFFLTANVSHGTLGLALCLVGMHSNAACKWLLSMFVYSLFGAGISDIFWSSSDLFLSVNIYSSRISFLFSRDQSLGMVVVQAAFLRRLSCIFTVSIRWSEDAPSKEEYASQFNAVLFHLIFIKT